MLILVTGATGKVGPHFIDRLLADPRLRRRPRPGALPQPDAAGDRTARGGARHHRRARRRRARRWPTSPMSCTSPPARRRPRIVMDVTVKGLFWLLEAFRASPTARRFVLIGGDAGVGHFHYRHDGPVTEATPHMAYPGCYALSKVLEEVMLGAVRHPVRPRLDAACARPGSWRRTTSATRCPSATTCSAARTGRRWSPPEIAARCRADGHRAAAARRRRPPAQAQLRPRRRPRRGHPGSRSTIRAPRRRLYNIGMDEPVDYGALADYLNATRGLAVHRHPQPLPLDLARQHQGQARARLAPALRPRPASSRPPGATSAPTDDPRKVWYPG